MLECDKCYRKIKVEQSKGVRSGVGRVGKYATILNVFQVRTNLVSDKNSSIAVGADRIMKKRDPESIIQTYG